MTKTCSCCYRVMAVEQFRIYMNRGAPKQKSRCRQCEAGDRALRKEAYASYVPPPPDPFASLMQSWRGPTNPPPLRSAV